MSVRPRIDRVESLPPLAWCAVVRPQGDVRVVAGALVEQTEHGWHEGAWIGEFDAGRLDLAEVSCATGAVVVGDRIVFSTTTDTLQALFAFRGRRALVVSNSLHLLLRVSGQSLLPGYLTYDVDLVTVMFGLTRYRKRIPTTGGHLGLHFHCNLDVAPDLTVTTLPKPSPPPFEDFNAYDRFLTASTERLVANAQAPGRRQRFRALATVSTGYDSPACAVLAARAGCREAFTFTTARSDFEESDDSGRDVGACLGLSTAELDPTAYRASTTLPECEFVAGGVGGDDVVFASAEPVLANTLVFTGFHGDKVWDRHNHRVSRDIVRGDPSGAGLTEFRLRVGFINAALPFFGCTRHPEIHAVSNSTEMAPWSIGDKYDRPVPRRLVETAGVPRGAFGTQKKAVARPYLRTDGRGTVEGCLSAHSQQAFRAFLQPADIDAVVTRALRRHRLSDATVGRLVRSYRAGQLERILGVRLLSSPERQWQYSQRLSPDSMLFYWASLEIASRYRQAPTIEDP
jgi:hypothetical protein